VALPAPAAGDGLPHSVGAPSAFERNSIRFLSGGFAVFIALCVIRSIRYDGVSGWSVWDALGVLMLEGMLVAIAVAGLPRDEEDDPAFQSSLRRFHELADPARHLTPEDFPPVPPNGGGDREA
jgi:hypothetical protein